MTETKTNIKTNTAADIREAFLSFFESHAHTRVTSSSLIPANDPTLLFTNAGMNQFKDCFLGLDKRTYVRATSSQKCVRAGGKHNDLDNVGYTARHHTFFEMLGNFSFGDYFKQSAINYAWQFLTSETWLNIPKDRLYVTVYATDDEAYNIWQNDIGLSADRIIRIGDNKGTPYASDNFWAMGDTGPCGPCTEIFYDHGDHIAGGLPGTADEDGDRFIEIWNCVFMQFNRTADGVLHPLPAPSVDTGMGLERISAVMQHVNSNYDIDIFKQLITAACHILNISDEGQPSLRVLADHARSCSFLIADGVIPSNEGRGYVLRRIIRRAVRHGNKLGAKGLFFYQLVDALANCMGDAYPELISQKAQVIATLKKEEEQFARTLEHGLKHLETELHNVKDVIAGDIAFKLYDTYGFPLDLTADIARERNLIIDEAGFNRCMEEQRARARDAGKFTIDYNSIVKVEAPSTFTGYDGTLSNNSDIVAIYKDGQPTASLVEGEEGLIVLAKTPFYAESGGQVGDTGKLSTSSGIFEVHDTKKSGNAIVHQGILVMGRIHKNESVTARVQADLRQAIMRNHSATHLLHAALRKLLGEHVQQKGSMVSSDTLRFDFSHGEAVTLAQLITLEQMVNQQIIANHPVETLETDMETAMNKGAMALFGEKYGDTVRVLSMGEKLDDKTFSVELCGGTHVSRTGDIGLFKMISEGGIAAGVRRIEAKTGLSALHYIQAGEAQLSDIASLTKAQRPSLSEKVTQLLDRTRDLDKQVERLNQKLAASQSKALLANVQHIANRPTLLATLEHMDSKTLRTMLDTLKSQLPNAIIVLAGIDGDKVSLMASVDSTHITSVKAGDIIAHLANGLGGKGGGKPDLAQGGAPLNANFAQIFAGITDWLAQKA